MATREEIAFIRDARAGKASAQLALGKRYLFGGDGLKKNLMTSLYWLQRAASRSEPEAWLLIGNHVPYEIAMCAPDPLQLCVWYERAFDAGVPQAGLVWAKLVLKNIDGSADHPLRRKALSALEKAADSGILEAQWMLAQELKRSAGASSQVSLPIQAGERAASKETANAAAIEWAERAASNGVLHAQRALAEYAWSINDCPMFLRWALPAAHALAQRCATSAAPSPLEERDVQLLSRYGRALIGSGQYDADEVERFLHLAGTAGDKDAQYALGIWYANMDESGERISNPARRSRYAKAVQWLTLAGEGGSAKAWYALYRICLRPNIGLSQEIAASAQRYLEHAAEMGYCTAQLELGTSTWRRRRSKEENDIRAVYWLQKAAFQESRKARVLLQKITKRAAPATWALVAQCKITPDIAKSHPFLVARIQLAAAFGLSIPEALLVDLNHADCGHCLVIDIRNHYAKSKRRLILIETGDERSALTQITRHFANIDCGPHGPEGNYRKRQYLFNKLFSESEHKAQESCEIG